MRIRIIKVPRGDAPELVRKVWVGVELEAPAGLTEPGGEFVGIDGKPKQLGDPGPYTKAWCVPAEAGLMALSLSDKPGSTTAVNWWKPRIVRGDGRNTDFVFAEDEAMPIGD